MPVYPTWAAISILRRIGVGLIVREIVQVETPFGPIAGVEVRTADGGRSFRPEYEDCAQAARASSVPIDNVYRAAERAAEDRGSEPA